MGCTSRVDEVRKASSASARASSGERRSSTRRSTSSTSARVTPARQPDDSGGVTQPAVEHDEHVGAGALAQRRRRCWRRSPRRRPRSLAPRQRDDVLGVGRRLQRRRAALRSLRGHGTTTTVGGRRPRRSSGAGGDDHGRPAVAPRSEPSGAGAAGDRDAQPAVADGRWRRRTSAHGRAQHVVGRATARPRPAAERAQPVEVAAHGERRAVVAPSASRTRRRRR